MKCNHCGVVVPDELYYCHGCIKDIIPPCPSCAEKDATIKAWQLRFLTTDRDHAAALAEKDAVIRELAYMVQDNTTMTIERIIDIATNRAKSTTEGKP